MSVLQRKLIREFHTKSTAKVRRQLASPLRHNRMAAYVVLNERGSRKRK